MQSRIDVAFLASARAVAIVAAFLDARSDSRCASA